MTVRTRGKLRYRPESGIGRLRIRKRRKAPRADALIAVHLRHIRLVHCTSANVLGTDVSCSSQLVFQAKTPLHEVWRMKFSIRYRRDGDRRKTSCGTRLCRYAGTLALLKSRTKGLIGGHGCVNRTVRHSRRNRCATHCSLKSGLESLDVGWVETDHIGDGAGQYVAENPEADTQHGLGFKLP